MFENVGKNTGLWFALEINPAQRYLRCRRLSLTVSFARREIQLQIKDWEVKQVESQRKVKITSADWLDHPDRYLLELAGRPSYATNAS